MVKEVRDVCAICAAGATRFFDGVLLWSGRGSLAEGHKMGADFGGGEQQRQAADCDVVSLR